MKFSSIYAQSKTPVVSIELFPPKTLEGEQSLMRHVEVLLRFHPGFITCTYGAGGSTREKTLGIVAEVKRRFGVPVASHLTCVGSSQAELLSYLQRATDVGVDFIVALRGDPPAGESQFVPQVDGLRYASELVTLICRNHASFGIAVAGYPEVHREAESPEADLMNLRRKVEAGGEIVITQLFYHNEDFFRFRERCAALGIKAPIIPGILPVTNLGQIQRITALCGAKLPAQFVAKLGRKEDPEWQMEVGVEQASNQVGELLRAGVPGVHFYVLNKSDATSRVLESLDLGKEPEAKRRGSPTPSP
jgi:methylenetetrahydrofolate reductase (NADPH)